MPSTLWDRLLSWSARRFGAVSPVLLGIAHDVPGITPPDRCRFDAAIQVPRSFAHSEDIGFQVVPGGLFGVTTHVGPYATLGDAYRTSFERLARMKRYRMVGLPTMEMYASTRIDTSCNLNQTDICLRVASS